MNLEKVFKNLIIILLVLIVLATISAFYQSDAVSDFNENTPFGIFERMGWEKKLLIKKLTKNISLT